MSADPILILQMHRMGDLILTMPLLVHLHRHWPEHEVWVAAEPRFFQGLMPLLPNVVLFPPSHCAALAERHYELAINLSSRPQALDCQARLKADRKLGPESLSDNSSSDSGSNQHIRGYWQLYRAALTQNNWNNAFHWADLHLLDLFEHPNLSNVPHPRPKAAGSRRVGLVLGASEAAKRPSVDFWTRLTQRLAAEGIVPLLLGGSAEQELGHEVARRAGLPRADLCGRLSIKELAALMRTLDLCITPDTGPMHLADLVGVPVLNLSMGPVHARETGPTSPGQYVLRAAMSCVGCWQCYRTQHYCKQAFTPSGVASLVLSLLHNAREPYIPPGLALSRTGRDSLGLHSLERLGHPKEASCRPLLEDFWQTVFLFLYDPTQGPLVAKRLDRLRSAFPRVAESIASGLAALCAHCAQHLRTPGAQLAGNFWRSQPPTTRLFTGHIHMQLQNGGYSRRAWVTALENLDKISALFIN
ncbi:MAG: glycosyltransferase family 9 protein [Desulfovibrio sp.]|nr:glycosyltransferase family 9 protein [Desulfovibrio sp.]